MFHFVTLEKENDLFVYMDAVKVLMKILDNILRAPQDPKYRKLKVRNEVIASVILPAKGGLECLLYFGFEMNDETFVMPPTVSISRLQKIRNELSEHRKTVMAKIPVDLSISNTPVTRYPFFEQIRSYSKLVLAYENQELQKAARDKIPFDELHKRLEKKKRDKMTDLEKEFGLLFEMMMWFKNEFFKWMDNPTCEQCKTPELSVFKGYSTNPANFVLTDRVEVYECEGCDRRLTFPRYNNPATLLRTRTGRCGEWANCFTLMCRAMGFDARYVVDRTDHVWTEVYSNSQKKWIHCDSCEGEIDAPLIYEVGWKKQLDYVIACSKDEVQDVTWRYTANFAEILSRRKACSETALLRFMFDINDHLQASLPPERKAYLRKRRVMECAEFLTPSHPDKQYGGRLSGSLQWRLSRGECQFPVNKYTWQPNETELQRKRFRIRYSTAKDKYHRVETDEIIEGWDKRVYEFSMVFRKVEYDWRMCYLCRTMDELDGSITWKFCAENMGVIVDKVRMKYQCTTFHSGIVKLILCNEDTCISLDPTKNEFETHEFRGSYDLSLMAVVNADGSDGSWQHAQLFRQSIDDNEYLFELDVIFDDDPKKETVTDKTTTEEKEKTR